MAKPPDNRPPLITLRDSLGGRYLVSIPWAILELGLSAADVEGLRTQRFTEVRGYTLLPAGELRPTIVRERYD